jgi:hypothetical protein
VRAGWRLEDGTEQALAAVRAERIFLPASVGRLLDAVAFLD